MPQRTGAVTQASYSKSNKKRKKKNDDWRYDPATPLQRQTINKLLLELDYYTEHPRGASVSKGEASDTIRRLVYLADKKHKVLVFSGPSLHCNKCKSNRYKTFGTVDVPLCRECGGVLTGFGELAEAPPAPSWLKKNKVAIKKKPRNTAQETNRNPNGIPTEKAWRDKDAKPATTSKSSMFLLVGLCTLAAGLWADNLWGWHVVYQGMSWAGTISTSINAMLWIYSKTPKGAGDMDLSGFFDQMRKEKLTGGSGIGAGSP